jgi:DNA-binding SARP family transcriptional activator/tetratricopeptide (TPR) repeat protein
MTCDVRFKILGSLDVSIDGSSVAIGAGRQRTLLARLLLDANRSLHPDALIDSIWGDSIPQHPDAALQIVVSRLRTALGCAADRLTSGPAGYRIEVGDDEADHLRARRAFARAEELWAQHDFEGVAAASNTALSCWTADALADLADTPFYEVAHAELRELRLAVYELRNRAYFRRGRHVEIAADIGTWIRAEPWRERLRAHQMLALYRSGRRVDALAVYDDFCASLAGELAVEPSTFVREMYERIREQDPTLTPSRVGIVGALPAWTPCALPFVGRMHEESQIFERLRAVAEGGARMVLIEGEAGIGKSRLALEVARRAHDDAIILPVDGADALRPGLHMIAAALSDASSHLGDEELRLCLGRWPGDAAELAPALRRRFPDLPPALDADDATRSARLRAAIASWIAGLSQRAPVLLVVDDLHRAGPALLLLLGALLVDGEPKRVLVLATARAAADRSSRLEQLTRSLQSRGVLDRIELDGLACASVGRMLTELGRPESTSVVAQLTLTTHGHPYLLGEMLRDSEGSKPANDDDVTGRIRHFVRRRVAALGEPGATLLGMAAAVDGSFDVALLAELSRGTVQSTEGLVDRAIEAGLLHVTGLGTFDFAHDLARRAIAEELDHDVRATIDHRLATVLEQREVAPARVAAAWNRVVGPEADTHMVLWAERAGLVALADLDADAAARWFRLGVDRATDDRTRAHLLIRLAGAQCQAADRAGVTTLRAALEIVRRLDDTDLLVEAATVWTPIWASMPTLTRDERVDLLTESAQRAPAGAVRAQLLARLGTELAQTVEWPRARELADEALAEALHSGDRTVVPEVCMRHFGTTGAPHNLELRRQYMRDVLAMTADGHDPIQRFFALSLAACASVEAGELEEADETLDSAFALARSTDVPFLAYNAECIRAWRAGLAGDLDEAERLALAAMRLGTDSGIDYAVIGPGLQLSCIRWLQGRFADLVPLLRVVTKADDVGATILLARALVCTEGAREEAIEVFAKVTRHDFEDLPLGLHWAGCLVAAAEVAWALEDRRVGAVVRGLLEPFADLVVFDGTWVIAPVAYGAGIAAAAAGDADADHFFEQALTICEHLRAPMLRARTELAWSRLLVARGRSARDDDRTVPAVVRDVLVEHRIEPVAGSTDAFYRQAEAALAALR